VQEIRSETFSEYRTKCIIGEKNGYTKFNHYNLIVAHFCPYMLVT